MDNRIHPIINHNLLLIHRIINQNLINTTSVSSIFRIEEHNKLVPKMIMIEKKRENMAIFIVEYTHLTKKVPIIPLGNSFYARKKNPTDYSLTYLRTETKKMHLKKSLPYFQSKEKE